MVSTPNTWGVVLLFVVVFLACILWATHGHTAEADHESQDGPPPGKVS